jgi:hypothetical protein
MWKNYPRDVGRWAFRAAWVVLLLRNSAQNGLVRQKKFQRGFQAPDLSPMVATLRLNVALMEDDAVWNNRVLKGEIILLLGYHGAGASGCGFGSIACAFFSHACGSYARFSCRDVPNGSYGRGETLHYGASRSI